MPPFQTGQQYSSRELRQALGLPHEASGGGWFAGYQRHGEAFYVFASIRPRGGRGRNDRRDHWEDGLLAWNAKGEARRDDPAIRELSSGRRPVHVFYRTGDAGPFIYAGQGTVKEIRDTAPVTLVWACEAPPPAPPRS
jgi:hypothetical protein